VHRSIVNLGLVLGLTVATLAAALPVAYQASGYLGLL
jgi:hypothetical protein